ncbi:MAG: tryptophan-rich sensory protein [Acidobacteriaceae bacterium]
MTVKRYRWWHGVAFYAGVHIAQLALRAGARSLASCHAPGGRKPQTRKDDREFYEAERLPVFAPPGAAFPIAWGINSICLIAGGLYVLDLPAETAGRKQFLRAQAAAWAFFALFDPAYFGLRSPINAAAVTLFYSAATAASLDAAWRKMHDPRAALSLATTVAWLALANPVGATQAAWNRDPFWGVGPFTEPPTGWAKEAKAA